MKEDQDSKIKEAIQWAKSYSSKAERNPKEMLSKLKDKGLDPKEAEKVLTLLIKENYINETRYAKLYSISKFNQNQWGKNKIRQYLNQMGISKDNILLGLEQIPEEEYQALCQKLCERKARTLKGNKLYVIKQKTIAFLLSKGFEYEDINQALQELDLENL